MHRIALIVFVTPLVLVGIIIIQLANIKWEHSGRCGLIRSTYYVLIFKSQETISDEPHMTKRWECAHGIQCKRDLWAKGNLFDKRTKSEYWPALHRKAAESGLTENEILTAPIEDLTHLDPLGRTVSHWIATRIDGIRLLELLEQRGVNTQAKDELGLTPNDWRENFLNNCPNFPNDHIFLKNNAL